MWVGRDGRAQVEKLEEEKTKQAWELTRERRGWESARRELEAAAAQAAENEAKAKELTDKCRSPSLSLSPSPSLSLPPPPLSR